MFQRSTKGSYLISTAIIIAGVLIAGVIVLAGQKSSTNGVLTAPKTASGIIDANDDPMLGNPEASVTFINFGDFRCQFCARFQREIKPAIIEKYVKTGKVKYVYRDLITMGENSVLAAEAANCAGEQEKYWDYADYLHGDKARHGVVYTMDSLSEIASSLELDVSLFKQCLASGKHKEEIKKDTDDALKNGATGTPAVFINGRIIVGLNPFEEYERIIEEELNKAQKRSNN